MYLLIPLDLPSFVPFAGMLDKLLLDFDLLDVVVWFPRLSWAEFGKAIGAVIACKCITDQIERWAFAPIKSRLKTRLLSQLRSRWPGLANRFGLGA